MSEKTLRYKRIVRKYGSSLFLLLPYGWSKAKKIKANDELIVEESKDKLIITNK